MAIEKQTVVIATIMRPEGETGVQAHFNALIRFLTSANIGRILVTPYSAAKLFVYPTFAARKFLALFSPTLSVWWYRTWHAFFLERALRTTLRRELEAVVYAQCPLSAAAALRARVRPQQRVVLVVHFNVSQADEWAGKGDITRDGHYYRSIRRFEEDLLPRLDGLVFVSGFMQQEVIRRVPGVSRIPAVVVPNFVDAPEERDLEYAPSDLISIGTLEPRKNQRFLLHVLAKCAAKGRRYTLTLIGDGPDRANLEQLARQHKVDGQVRFLGFRKNAAKYLAGHRAYCHSALLENLPVAIIEAFSVGLPVFANRVGGIPEMMEDRREGRFWSLDDPDRAADMLMEVLEDESTLLRMSRNAISAFERRFALRAVGPRLVAFIQNGTLVNVPSAGPAAA